jgi:cytochrome c55X
MPDRRRATLLVLAACLPPALAATAQPPSAGRQAELLHRLKHDCGSCHGMTLKGGLGPSLLPEALAGKDPQGLVDIVLHGVPGTPMPPWDVELSAAEAAWLVEQLKTGVRP